MSLLSIVATLAGTPPEQATQTVSLPGRIAAIRSGGGPNWWARLNGASTVVDEVGTNDGTVVNSGDVAFRVGSLVTDGADDNSMAFGATTDAAGGFTIAAPFQSVQFTVSYRLQVDLDEDVQVLLTIGNGDSVSGEAILKLVSDGVGGVRPQFESFGAGGFCVKVGDQPGTIPIGQSIRVTFVRTPEDLKVYVGPTEISMSVSSGALSAWGATPNATWKFFFYPSDAAGLPEIAGYNGLAADVIVCNSELSVADIASLSLNSRSIAVARDYDMGDIAENAPSALTTSAERFVHPEAGTALSVVTQPSVGTAGVSGLSLTLTPASVASNTDVSFTYRMTHANGTDTGVASATILNAGVVVTTDLPYLGKYFGTHGAAIGNGNNRLRQSDPGESHFFFAERSGRVTSLQWHWRSNGTTDPSGYSAGDGGHYRFGIKAANPSTKRPISGTPYICQTAIISPGNPAISRVTFHTYNFQSPGTLTAKQPYCLMCQRTTASGYVSTNYSTQANFNDPNIPCNNYVEPGDGPGVGSINVASGGIEPDAVGSSVAIIKGWAPVKIDGIRYHPFSIGTQDGVLRTRIGDVYSSLIWSDGFVTNGSTLGSEINVANWIYDVTGSTQCRIIFRPNLASHTVSGVFIWAWRVSGTGNINVDLLSGPTTDAHNPASSGTLIERVVVNQTNWLLCGLDYQRNQAISNSDSGLLDLAHWVWVPFAVNRTLTQNAAYTIRLSATGTAYIRLNGTNRQDNFFGPSGRSIATWSQYFAQTQNSWNAWYYSRGGAEASTNGGSSWVYKTGRVVPILFKCV